jgi:hypothetical protein
MNKVIVGAIGALVVLVAVGLLALLRQELSPAPAASAPAASAAVVTGSVAAAASEPVAPPPPAAASVAAVPAVAASGPVQPVDIESALVELLGRKAVLSWMQTDDFARRFVATVDNLGRSHAPARLWPVNPAPGRFTTDRTPDGESIGLDNAQRYTPYILMLETLDLRKAIGLYAALYPRLQSAYVDLGFPKQRFHDRLLEVIDLLLATPLPEQLPAVVPPRVQGEMQITRPWVLYEYKDPAWQALSAGQRLLLRLGPVNERRVKARLTELRALLQAAPPAVR